MQWQASGILDQPTRAGAGPGVPISVELLAAQLEAATLRCRLRRLVLPRETGVPLPAGEPLFLLAAGGRCRLQLHGHAQPLLLRPGDIVVLLRHPGLTLRNERPPRPAGAAPAARLLAGALTFQPALSLAFLAALPQALLLARSDRHVEPWLAATLTTLASSPAATNAQPLVDQLARAVLQQALRVHAASLDGPDQPCGDTRIARMLAAVHARPEAPWTVNSLAEEAGMSRSAFATLFTALLGRTPMRYLLECRVRRACGLLRGSDEPLKRIARLVGYGSESAFSNAFKRHLGLAPGAYRNGQEAP